MIENMEHDANTHNHSTKNAGAFDYKLTKSQNINAPHAFKSEKLVSQAAPHTHLQKESSGKDFHPDPSGPPMESSKEEGTS